MPNENTNATNVALGNVRTFFGTSEARGPLGIVIQSHGQQKTSEEATVKSERGNDITLEKYNPTAKITISGVMIRDAAGATTNSAARAALAVGSTFAIPSNRALSTVQGIPVIDDIDEQTSNTDFASMSITATCRPGITSAAADDSSVSDSNA